MFVNFVYIFVADNGPGITEDDFPKVFQPFFTTKQDGLGIGLTLCESIIKAHHGNLSVKNKDGNGCEFTIKLPRCNKNA